MEPNQRIKSRIIAAIQQTGDPTAPIKLQNTASALQGLGKMLAATTTPAKVEQFTNELTSQWDEEQLNKDSADPAFVMALAAMLYEALVRWTGSLKETPE